MFIIVTILINVLAIAIWSVINGENGFLEAAKMLRGEPAFRGSGGKNITKGSVGKTQEGTQVNNPNEGQQQQ